MEEMKKLPIKRTVRPAKVQNAMNKFYDNYQDSNSTFMNHRRSTREDEKNEDAYG